MTKNILAPCKHSGSPPEDVVERVAELIASLHFEEQFLNSKGVSSEEYQLAMSAAIERLRGRQSASNFDRRGFLESLLAELLKRELIDELELPSYGRDTVYRLRSKGLGDVAIIQKGCPDGRHSSVAWSRPDWAEEAYLWWCCSSMTYEPFDHIRKGVNRLRSRFFSTAPDVIDGVIFHNELCGSAKRPCPKLSSAIEIDGQLVPPPCIFSMPSGGQDVDSWNWHGERTLKFPSILLGLFGIGADAAIAHTGQIGFRKKGTALSTKIIWNYGAGRSHTYRS